ncbi:MAG: multicomponent Na+:H+ antiporter subunit [Candidatus Sumerlaeota bacterium]|nr:multicomponent Na+:H+ antiporter subunit [Candidatus Sumerlaeota bacterium]
MAFLTSFIVFLLFASGLYLIMQRNLFEVLLGTNLLSHGTNLFLISMSGWHPDTLPPILVEAFGHDPSPYVDPVPQALILTAIVISFGVTAFLVVLMMRGVEETGTLEAGELAAGEDEE